jgi:hypothetical protein
MNAGGTMKKMAVAQLLGKWLSGGARIFARARVAGWIALTAAALCSAPAAAQSSTSAALIGNIQSSSSGTSSSGATTHYFRSGQTERWTVTGGTCSNPYFVYVDSTQFGYRELLSTVMLAKVMGKQVYFIGQCTDANHFKTNYVIMLD